MAIWSSGTEVVIVGADSPGVGQAHLDGPQTLPPGVYTWTVTIETFRAYNSQFGISFDFEAGWIGKVIGPPGDEGEVTRTGTLTVHEDGTQSNTGDVLLSNFGNNDIDGIGLYVYMASAGPNPGTGTGTVTIDWLIETDEEEPPPPPPDEGTEVVVHGPDGTLIGEIEDATDPKFRIERKGTGQGSFVLNRNSANATSTLIAQGNLVKVYVPRISTTIPVFSFFMELDVDQQSSRDEQGGENLTISGRGVLSYLDRAIAWNQSFVVPAGIAEGGTLHGPASTGNKAGQILRRAIAEWQHVDRPQQPIPELTIDFDYTVDSDGNTWTTTPMTAELGLGYVGERGLVGIGELLATDEIDIILDHNLVLHAYNHYGRDLTSATFASNKVRFVKGVNIGEVQRQVGLTLPATHILVRGDEDAYGYNFLPDAGSRPTVEGFIQTQGTDVPTLNALGLGTLRAALSRGESIPVEVAITTDALIDPTVGMYLPGPEGTNGHFWIGDDVTLHTGTGTHDFNNESLRIEAITISVDRAANINCVVELAAVMLTGRAIPVASGGPGTIASSGNAGGSPAPGGPPPAPAIHAHAASTVTFAPDAGVAAANVQDAIEEVAGDQTAHLADATDAHDASAISIVDAGAHFTATDVEGALQELGAGGGGGAPTTADYLVGTAQAGLSAEIVVGTSPGGELGGTWASPTVDGTHSGSNHNQPVRKNSAGSVLERRRLNFIEGSNVTLTIADDAGDDEVDITIASSGGGGGLTQAFVGYNTIGGTWETMTAARAYAKKITLANDCLITDIEAYIQQTTSDSVGDGVQIALYDDSAGTPDNLLMGTGHRGDSILLDNAAGASGASRPRWFGRPVGRWVVAGDYWIVVATHDAVGTQIAKDTSGTDRYYTSGGAWFTDWGFYTPTTTTDRYSIRANTIR